MQSSPEAMALLMVVEDELPIVELLQALVAPLGCTIVHASGGEQALRLLDEQRLLPDLFLLDLVMPQMSGFDLCAAIRTRPAFRVTPILAMTALSDWASIRRAYAAGADDYIVKPFTLELVEAKLRTFLRWSTPRVLEAVRPLLEELAIKAGQASLLTDVAGRVVRLDRGFARALGVEQGEALGCLLAELAEEVPTGERPRLADVDQPFRRLKLRRKGAAARAAAAASGATTLTVNALLLSGREEPPWGTLLLAAEGPATSGRESAALAEQLSRLEAGNAVFVHEIRNPLAAISAAGQMLLRDDLPSPVRQRMARAVTGEAERLTQLAHDHLGSSVPGAMVPMPADLRSLLTELAELNLLGIPCRDRVTFELEEELPAAMCVVTQLKQVLLNLLLNALEAIAGTSGGRVVLRARARPGLLALEVEDNGRGIPLDSLPHLFNGTLSAQTGHSGLGLPLSARLVAAQGGRLEVTSYPGSGTTFTVLLPLAP